MDAFDYGDFMTTVADEWPNSPIGEWAQEWLNVVQPVVSPWVAAVASSTTTLPFSELPEDYYAPGVGYLYTRSSWSSNAMSVLLQMGEGSQASHLQEDWGHSRSTPATSSSPSHTRGIGSISRTVPIPTIPSAFNGILYNGNGQIPPGYEVGTPQVLALESTSTFTYAAVNLTGTYQSDDTGDQPSNNAAGYTVREFLFIKPLNTLFVIDRLQSTSASDTQTFLLHTPGAPDIVDPTMSRSQTVTRNCFSRRSRPRRHIRTASWMRDQPMAALTSNACRIVSPVRPQMFCFTRSSTGSPGSDPVGVAITGSTSTTWTITFTWRMGQRSWY